MRTDSYNGDINGSHIEPKKFDDSGFLFENLTVGLYRTTPDGTILLANPALVKMLGFDSFEELSSRNLEKTGFESPEARGIFKSQFIKNKEIFGFETSWLRKDGTFISIKENAKAVKNETGEVLFYDGTVENITNCKNTEIRLKETERKYTLLFENVQDVLYQVDLNGIVLDVSPSIKYFTEFNREDIIGNPVSNLYYNPEDRISLLALLSKYGEVKDFEIKIKTNSGDIKYASINARLVYDSKGNPREINGSIRDINDRVKTQLEFRKIKQAIEQSSVSILITDINGNIEYVNTFFTEQTGYDFEDVKGLTPSIIKSTYHEDNFYKELWDTILAGKNWQGEMLNKKKNNELYWANVVITPISNNGAKITHFVAIQEDITEKKLMLEELVEAKRKAEEANELKSNFLANMSHELRTPLVGILGYSELLSVEVDNSEHREMASTILLGGKRLMETLNSILDISRIESDKQSVKLNSLNLLKIIHESANIFRNSALQKGLFLDFSFPEKPVFLISDGDLLLRIFNNLISNAVKYTEKGGILIKVAVNSDANSVKVDIIDTGIGISKEYHNLVFEPFRQVSEGLSRNFEGTGLGLSITRRLAALLNGTLSFKSDIGQGSVFTLELPLSKDDIIINVENLNTVFEQSVEFNNLSKNHTVLIVEDDLSNALMATAFIEEYVSVDHVINGFEAIDKCRIKKYDAILMDINLKGIDGTKTLNLIRALNEYYSKIPIFAVTAYAMRGDKEKFLSLGFDAYLPKPFDRNQILQLLSSHLRKYEKSIG